MRTERPRPSSFRRSYASHQYSDRPKLKLEVPSVEHESSSSSATQQIPLTPTVSRRKAHKSHLSVGENASLIAMRPESGHGYSLDAYYPPRREPSTVSSASQLGPMDWSGDNIHPTLDRLPSSSKQSVTHTASVSRLAKLPHALVLTRLERAGLAVQSEFSEVLRKRIVHLAMDDADLGPAELHAAAQPHLKSGEWNLPSGFCVVYVCGLGNGKERPPLPSFLVGWIYFYDKSPLKFNDVQLEAFAFNITILLESPVAVLPPGLLRAVNPLVTMSVCVVCTCIIHQLTGTICRISRIYEMLP